MEFLCERLTWNLPLLPQVVEFLIYKAKVTESSLSLDHIIVVVPTRQAGRSLQEALVKRAKSQGSGLFPPRVVTPNSLFQVASRETHSASSSLVLATWSQVLKNVNIDSFPQLFPTTFSENQTLWLLKLAMQLEELQSELSESNLSFAEVASRVENTDFEPERWRELAILETLFFQALEAIQKECPNRSRRNTAENPQFEHSVQQIIIAGTADPSPLSLTLLNRAKNQGIDVTILQYGDLNETDPRSWLPDGRPDFSHWAKRDIPLDERIRFHLNYGPKELVKEVYQSTYEASQQEEVALGTLDPEFSALIEQEFHRNQTDTYNPQGISLSTTELGKRIQQIQDFALQKDFLPVWNLLRDPSFFKYILRKTLTDSPLSRIPHEALLIEIDQLQEQHLCQSIESLKQILSTHPDLFPLMRQAISILQAWIHTLRESPFEVGLEQILLEYYGERWISESDPDGRIWIESFRAFSELLSEIRELRTIYPTFSSSEIHSLLGNLIRKKQLYPERTENAIDLRGWLELLWEEAPRMVLAGFHEGVIPAHVQGDPFLPESLRRFLKMTSNEERLGREAYLFHALLASRTQKDSIHIHIARWSPQKTALKPSRILFQTSDSRCFLNQVHQLIRAEPAPEESSPFRTRLRVTPPDPEIQKRRISITALKTFLSHPFDFYLSYFYQWETYSRRKSEMGNQDLGTLFHTIMQQLLEQTRGESLSSEVLYKSMMDIAQNEMNIRFGTVRSFPIRLQWQNLQNRLYHCAQIEENLRREGWENQYVEHKIEYPVQIGDQTWILSGIIDRIDAHPEEGYRIIDYKTGRSQGSRPERSHYRKMNINSPDPVIPEARFSYNGSDYRWEDLQLPLYEITSRSLLGKAPGAAHSTLSYFYVPASTADIRLNSWKISEEECEAAQVCLTGILNAIERHQFWSDKESLRFSSFFPEGLENMIHPEPFISHE